MKELILPVKQENKIDISEIDTYFKGLIIAYKNDKPIGYFQNYNPEWYLMDGSNSENCYPYIPEDDSLYELIQYCVENKIIDSCKVIEFEN